MTPRESAVVSSSHEVELLSSEVVTPALGRSASVSGLPGFGMPSTAGSGAGTGAVVDKGISSDPRLQRTQSEGATQAPAAGSGNVGSNRTRLGWGQGLAKRAPQEPSPRVGFSSDPTPSPAHAAPLPRPQPSPASRASSKDAIFQEPDPVSSIARASGSTPPSTADTGEEGVVEPPWPGGGLPSSATKKALTQVLAHPSLGHAPWDEDLRRKDRAPVMEGEGGPVPPKQQQPLPHHGDGIVKLRRLVKAVVKVQRHDGALASRRGSLQEQAASGRQPSTRAQEDGDEEEGGQPGEAEEPDAGEGPGGEEEEEEVPLPPKGHKRPRIAGAEDEAGTAAAREQLPVVIESSLPMPVPVPVPVEDWVCGMLPPEAVRRAARLALDLDAEGFQGRKRKRGGKQVEGGPEEESLEGEEEEDPKMVKLPRKEAIERALEELGLEMEKVHESIAEMDESLLRETPRWGRTYSAVLRVRQEAVLKARDAHAAAGMRDAKPLAPIHFSATGPSSTPLSSERNCDPSTARRLVCKVVRDKKVAVRSQREYLASLYLEHRQAWRNAHNLGPEDDDEDDLGRGETEGEAMMLRRRLERGVAAVSGPRSINLERASRSATARGEYVGSEYEVALIAKELVEKEKMRKRIEHGSAKVPDMILEAERDGGFEYLDDSNALLTTDGAVMRCSEVELEEECPPGCNCPKQLELQSRLLKPWSDMEKCIFLDKFLQFPKNFRKIASFLKFKNTRQTVEFYYNSKQYINYKALVKEGEMRRRGAEGAFVWLKHAAEQVSPQGGGAGERWRADDHVCRLSAAE